MCFWKLTKPLPDSCPKKTLNWLYLVLLLVETHKELVTSSVPGTDPEGTIGESVAAVEALVDAKRYVFVPWPMMADATRQTSRNHKQMRRFELKSQLRRCGTGKRILKKEESIILTIIISSPNAIFAAFLNNV